MQANKIVHHSFTDRRQKIPGSETKNFITHSIAGNMSTSIYASAPLVLKSNRGNMMGASDTCTHSELLYRRGIQNLRARIFNQAANITGSKK